MLRRILLRRSFGVTALLTSLAGNAATRADDYALVVGVNECPRFRNSDGSQPKPLRGAEPDAEGFAGLLVEQYRWPGKNVRVLKSKAATRAAIAATFAELTSKLRPHDSFVFYFSGHGTQVPDRKPFDEADRLDEALCPCDVTALGENVIIDDDLGVWIENLPCRNVAVILDCCHAGTAVKDDQDSDDDIAPRYLEMPSAAKEPKRPERPQALWRELRGLSKSLDQQLVAVFACRAEQKAYERRLPEMKAPARVGQFSHYLLEGLRNNTADGDGDGTITDREVYDYVQRRLDETFNRGRRHAAERQEPLLEPAAGERDNSPFLGAAFNSPDDKRKR